MPWDGRIRGYTRTCKSAFRARSNALRKRKTTLLVQAGFMSTGRQRGRLTLPGLLSGGSRLAILTVLSVGFTAMLVSPSMRTAFGATSDVRDSKLQAPAKGTKV